MAVPDSLLPWMKPLIARINGATEAVIQDELVYVINDFCREGHPWQKLLTGYNVVAGDPDISVNPIDNRTTCINVMKVFYNGQELGQAGYKVHATDGAPLGFTCTSSPSVITLIPTPAASENGAIDVLASLAPKDPTCYLPPFFETHHFEAILDGTLGRFYNQPLKPFSDKELARYHLKRYRAKTREAADMAARGYTPQAQNWAFPSFGV